MSFARAILILLFFATAYPAAAENSSTVILVDSLADELAEDGRCTLREALLAAETNSVIDSCAAGSPSEQDTITFAISGTIFLEGPLMLSRGLSIEGNGPGQTILDGSKQTGLLQIEGRGSGPIILRGLTLQNGRAARGGALNGLDLPCDGEVIIEDSLLRDSRAVEDGGAVLMGCGSWTIGRSTFAGNQAANGGGIAVISPPILSGDTILAISNSTFSGNTQGALFAQKQVTIDVRSSTIIGHGRYNIELAAESGSGRLTAIFSDTILANSAGPNCFRVHPLNVPPPQFLSAGHNLVDSSDCLFDQPGDRVLPAAGTLGPLALNGGVAPTHALLPGSAAIDSGSCSGGTINIDQRGLPRPQGPACDIGSFEFRPGEWVYLPLILP